MTSLLYLQELCRLVLIFIFLYSSLSKIRSVKSFEKAIANTGLVKNHMILPLAIVIISSELFTSLLLLIGQREGITAAFVASLVMLIVFTSVILYLLRNNIKTSCQCFGASSEELVSYYEVGRNIMLMGIALIGLLSRQDLALPPLYYLYMLIPALFIVLVITSFRQFIQIKH